MGLWLGDARAGSRFREPVVPEGNQASRMVLVGQVSGVYGVRGWVRVFSHTDPRANILEYRPWYLRIEGVWEEREVLHGRTHGKGVVAQLSGCEDRDCAAAIMGCDIAVRRDQLPGTARGEYYWTDLQGLRVVTTRGAELGRLDYLFATGANDVMVVEGDRQRMIPYRWGEVVREVDLAGGEMIVDWDPDF